MLGIVRLFILGRFAIIRPPVAYTAILFLWSFSERAGVGQSSSNYNYGKTKPFSLGQVIQVESASHPATPLKPTEGY